MVLFLLRALFVFLMAAVGWSFLSSEGQPAGSSSWLLLDVALVIGVFIVLIDYVAPRRKLTILSGTILGLVVGVCVAYALSFAVHLLVDQLDRVPADVTLGIIEQKQFALHHAALIDFIDTLVGIIACYLSISFILQTKDDFRFIIPYVEFTRQTKGARPLLLDANVLIDGRVGDVAATGVFDTQLVVPRFVQAELQRVADSSDHVARARGRRGLDILAKLKASKSPEVIDYDPPGRQEKDAAGKPLEVDARLLALAKELNARILTNDLALSRIAQVRGVETVNLNQLASALRPAAVPGERLRLQIIRRGDEPGQGVGFLDDGTMVVIEQGQGHIGSQADVLVTNTRQTAQGRMIFARIAPDSDPQDPPRSPATNEPRAAQQVSKA
jgi:uncharacterized protein YacL